MSHAERQSGFPPGLRRLARLHGVETSYTDVRGATQYASPEGVLAVLRGLDVAAESPSDVRDALRTRQLELARRVIEPVIVAWDGRLRDADLRLPSHVSGRLELTVTLESGVTFAETIDVDRLAAVAEQDIDGRRFVMRRFSLRRQLPHGYHRLRLRGARTSAAALLISAPMRAYEGGASRQWGVFLPLYALYTSRSWGAGNYTDLQRLIDWTAEQGGDAVATLPLFAGFLDRPFDPSPYSPASRLFWNEFFVDIEAAPELAQSEGARRLMASSTFRRRLTALRNDDLVHYETGMALRRQVLEHLARAFTRKAEMRAFRAENGNAEQYARFRATMEAQRKPWPKWPQLMRGGDISDDDYDPEVMRYHLYVQLLATEQMRNVSETARKQRVSLYLDMPLGAGPASYDVWRERESFAVRLSGGAPPDALFSLGQNWGFPPAHPDNIREHGYRYWIAVVRHLMKSCGVLRIDHIIGFHHLYCIPSGYDARHGVYVQYRAEELYAILSLESHRNKVLVVGEDLGTVPRYLPPAMRRHGVHETYVAQFEMRPSREAALSQPRALTVAAVNTHDTPTFASFWQGVDIDDRLDMGLINTTEAQAEHEGRDRIRKAVLAHLRGTGALGTRAASPLAVLRALLVTLGKSKTRLVLANLEDLWAETNPQNTPGTTSERINWRRRARFSLDEMRQLNEVNEPLTALDAARRRRSK